MNPITVVIPKHRVCTELVQRQLLSQKADDFHLRDISATTELCRGWCGGEGEEQRNREMCQIREGSVGGLGSASVPVLPEFCGQWPLFLMVALQIRPFWSPFFNECCAEVRL